MAKTVLKEGIGSVELLSSRFEAICFPFSGEDSFEELYKAFKKRFPKADHYPYAYVHELKWKSSDDGEPSGAAGRNYLELFAKGGIVRGCLICARYFGGSKLGLPRLRRTFLAAAEKALENCTLGEILHQDAFRLSISYHDYEILKRLLPSLGGALSEESFSENVSLKLLGDATILAKLKEKGLTFSYESLGREETIKEIAL